MRSHKSTSKIRVLAAKENKHQKLHKPSSSDNIVDTAGSTSKAKRTTSNFSFADLDDGKQSSNAKQRKRPISESGDGGYQRQKFDIQSQEQTSVKKIKLSKVKKLAPKNDQESKDSTVRLKRRQRKQAKKQLQRQRKQAKRAKKLKSKQVANVRSDVGTQGDTDQISSSAALSNLSASSEKLVERILKLVNSTNYPIRSKQARSQTEKTYNDLINQLDEQQLTSLIDHLCQIIMSVEVRNERFKCSLLDRIAILLRNVKLSHSIKFQLKIVKFMALHGFFAAGSQAKQVCPFGQSTQQQFRACLHRILVHVFKVYQKGDALSKRSADDNKQLDQKANKQIKHHKQHLLFLYQLIDYLQSLLFSANTKYIPRSSESKEPFGQIYAKHRILLKCLNTQDDKQNIMHLEAFQIFYSLLLLLVFEDVTTTRKSFQELNACFVRAFPDFTNDLSNEHNESEEDGETEANDEADNNTDDETGDEDQGDNVDEEMKDEQEDEESDIDISSLNWQDVLTDLILSYLLKSSQLIRTLVVAAFHHIKNEISQAAIEQICLALKSDDTDEDVQPDDNQDDEVDDASDDVDLDSDVADEDEEVEDGCEENESEDGDNNEESDISDLFSDDDEESLDGNEGVDEEFRLKLKQALGAAAVDSEEEDEGDHDEHNSGTDQEDNADNVLNDEEMMKFDKAIANVFRERRNQNRKLQTIAHQEFKSRCLDLVEILLNSRCQLQLSLLCMLAEALVDMTRKCLGDHTMAVITRATNLLAKFQKLKNVELDADANSYAENYFSQVLFLPALELSNAIREKPIQVSLYTFCSWVMHIANRIKVKENWSELVSEQLQLFFTRCSSPINPNFFMRLINTSQEFTVLILVKSVDLIDRANVRAFQQASGYQILTHALRTLATAQQVPPGDAIDTHLEKAKNLMKNKEQLKQKPFLLNSLLQFVFACKECCLEQFRSAQLDELMKGLLESKRHKRNLKKNQRTKLNKMFKTVNKET